MRKSTTLTRRYFAAILCIALSGCSTYSKKTCEQKDWEVAGMDAAEKGIPKEYEISHFQNTCGRDHGIQPNEAIFNHGYEMGLQNFCTPSNALNFARQGGMYNNTCPAEKEKAFLEKYQLGRIEYTGNRLHSLEQEVEILRRENSQKDMRIRELERRLAQPRY